KTEEKAAATPTNLLMDSDGNYLAETSLAVVDLPLALKISKVHAKTQKPLMGAAFQLKAADKLTAPLTFTVKDGVYWYDAKGSTTTIQMDKHAEALVYGLPAGKYQLEETVVPTNFFPAVPQSIEITMTNTSEAPKEVVVVNTPTVKLGIDSDKFNVVIAIALTVLIGGGLAVYTIIRRKRK
ncbi:MAG: prealbumin-like fold domain-containing protein, partial [Eubacteriales bacterium]|nr:prealbumin-like fold domain-containing protein [Eubacteriales bacterium]